MILRPTPISSRYFYLSTEYGARLLVEASDLPRGMLLGRVYDDACDRGFTIVFEDGHEVVFAEGEETRDREGDLLHTEFVPVKGDHTPGLVVWVFND